MSITISNLLTRQVYASRRKEHHAQLIAYRRARSMALGDHALLQFEDECTIRYQIQEMLRAERIEDEAGMQEQIDSYAILIPDEENWKATLMAPIPDAELRNAILPNLQRLGDHIYIKVGGHAAVYAAANEDLDSEDQRPSSVHFLRFELPMAMRLSALDGAGILVGCDHPAYAVQTMMPQSLRDRLAADLMHSLPVPTKRMRMAAMLP